MLIVSGVWIFTCWCGGVLLSARDITQAVDDRRLQASGSLSSRVAKQQPRLQLLQLVLWGVLFRSNPELFATCTVSVTCTSWELQTTGDCSSCDRDSEVKVLLSFISGPLNFHTEGSTHHTLTPHPSSVSLWPTSKQEYGDSDLPRPHDEEPPGSVKASRHRREPKKPSQDPSKPFVSLF